MNDYINVLKKYAVFNGRAQRKEYWMFTLINVIIYLVLSILGAVTKTPVFAVIYILYALAVLIPGLAVAFRRLHDTNRSAWWILIGLVPFVGGIILLVFMVLDSQPGENKYGPNPKGVISTVQA